MLQLQQTSRALQGFLIAQARASGLGLLEFLVLSRAAEADGVTSLEAARALGLSSSTMTGLADRLENDGLIRRAPHPTSRRLLLLRATAKGRRVRQRTIGPILARLTEYAAELEAVERTTVSRFHAEIDALVAERPNDLRSPGRPPPRASAPRRPRSPNRLPPQPQDGHTRRA